MPLNTSSTLTVANNSLSGELLLSTCASYAITVNARTVVGFNETLMLNEIVIPSAVEGPLLRIVFLHNNTSILVCYTLFLFKTFFCFFC